MEEKLRENVPHEYLVEAEAREKASRIARPVTERLKRMIEREVLRLMEEGRTENEILGHLTSKYDIHIQRRPIRSETKPKSLKDDK